MGSTYLPISWQNHIWLVIVIFIFFVCVYCELTVLPNPFGGVWTDCFPSGESIQVTDTKGWLQFKWPLKSLIRLQVWHLTIYDVAVESETRVSLQTVHCLHLVSWKEVHWGRRKDCALFKINTTKVRLHMFQCTSQWRCCFLFLLHCLIWVIRGRTRLFCTTWIIWTEG